MSKYLIYSHQGQTHLSKTTEFSTSSEICGIYPVPQSRNAWILEDNLQATYFNFTSRKSASNQNFAPAGKELACQEATFVHAKNKQALIYGDKIDIFQADFSYSEVSFLSLVSKIWYEGYDQAKYIWQSTGSDDGEAKLSLVPLFVGTLKASFYALLVAIPFAIGSAISSSFLLSRKLKNSLKFYIELIDAVPTVIIGFVAGLVFAPWLELNFLGFLLCVLLFPVTIWGFSYLYSFLLLYFPSRIFRKGFEIYILIPFMLGIFYAILMLGKLLDFHLFGDGFLLFLVEALGANWNQRNAIIVGIMMGFAVIPVIYSIVEDSISSVPQSLLFGSYAIGASRWQSLKYVVLPYATPAIFSATMLGMGRAMGETMIVLMASGNTALTNFNIFDGMRTLSANIAIEIPEAAKGDTLYRVLFLSGFCLFVITFIFNNLSEVVRNHLKKKYKAL